MADNTRKTSNIIHEVDKVKEDVSNNSQNIQNNTESIGNIKVYDSHIWLSTSKGLTVTQDGNTTTNNDQPTEWKLEADTNYLNTTLNFATQDDIPSVYVKDIQSGDITTLQVTNDGNGTYTLTATGGGGSGGGGGFENITLAEGKCIDITTEPYDDNGTEKTKITVATDTDCLNTTLNFAKPTDIGNGLISLTKGTGINVTGSNATANQSGNTSWKVSVDDTVALKSDIPTIPSPVVPGDGNITLKSTDNTVTITGQNATANQTSDTSWDLSVNIPTPATPGDGKIDLSGGTGIDVSGANATANQSGNTSWSVAIDSTVALKSDIPTIPPAVVPGDGNITLTEGDGIKVSGSDATANQTGDTAWTVKTDNDYLNTTLNFAKPDQIPVVPTELGVMTIQNVTPHAGGDFDFVSSDDAIVVNTTAHGLSLSIDEDKLDFVKEIKSGNELTLTVNEVDGVVTLTAAGGGGGGAGDIAFAGGKCIDVVPDNNATTNVTTYTINNDLNCLNTSLGFATDQDITNAIGNIAIPEKTSDLTNDGEDGINPFITAADIPAIPDVHLPIESVDATVIVDGASSVFTVSTGGTESFKIAANKDANFQGHVGILSPAFSTVSLALQGEVKPVNVGGAAGVWVSADYVVNPDAAYAKHARAFSSVKAPANGQAFDTFTQFHASAVCGNDVGTNFGVYVSAMGAKNNVGCFVTKGGGIQAGNWAFYDNTGYPSHLQGGIKTPSVRGLADNDAEVTLNSNFTVSTGGTERLTVRADGHIGQGYAGQANINYAIYQGFGVSGQEQLGFLAAPKFDAQPAIRCVSVESQPLFTDVVANKVVHFSARDDRGGNKPFTGTQTGFLVGDFTKSSTQNIGFDSAVSGVDNFAFLASGTSPSLFNGEIRVPKLVGLAHSTDASVTLDSNFTVSTGGTERVVVDSAGNVTIKEKLKGDGNYTPLIELASGYTVNVTQSRYYNRYAGDSGITHSESIFNINDEQVFSTLVYGPTYASQLPLDCPVGSEPVLLYSKDDFVYASSRVLFCSSVTNSRADFEFNFSDTANPVFIVNKGTIKTPSISGVTNTNASVTLGDQATLTKGDGSAYAPDDDASLVTKGWVTANGVGAAGFPIVSQPTQSVKIEADDDAQSVAITAGTRAKIEADGYEGTLKITAQVKDSSENAIEWSTGSDWRDPLMTLSFCGVLGFATEWDSNVNGRPDRCLPGIEVTNFYPNYQKDALNQDTEAYVYMFWGKTNPLNANSYEQERDPLLLIQSRTEQNFFGDDIEIPEVIVGPNYLLNSNSSKRSLTNKEYVDDKFTNWKPPLPEPGFPLPPVGINAGTTWVSSEDVPGLYMSAAFAINGVFSIVGFESFTNVQAAADHHDDYPDRNDYPDTNEYYAAVREWLETLPVITSTSKCYWTVDGQSWAEGYCANINPKYIGIQVSTGKGNYYNASPITNQYGRYCEADGLVYTGYAYSSGGTSWQKRMRREGYADNAANVNMGVPIYYTPNWGNFAAQNDPTVWDPTNDRDLLPANSPSWWVPSGTRPYGLSNRINNLYGIASVSLSEEESASVPVCFPTNEDKKRQDQGRYIHPLLYFDRLQIYSDVGGFFVPKVSPSELDLVQPDEINYDQFFDYFSWHAKDAASNPSGTVSMVIDENGNALWLDSLCTLATSVGAESGQMGTWGEGALCCTYNKDTQEYAVVFPDEIRFFQYEYGREAFRKQVDLPFSSSWRQIVYTAGRYLLIDPTGGLLTSTDGDTWVPSSAGSGPLITGNAWTLGGTNGRFITSGGSDVAGFPSFGAAVMSTNRNAYWSVNQIENLPEEVAEKRYYSFSSGIDQTSTTTADVNLNVPEDVRNSVSSTRKTILTQEDANEYFAEEIAKKATVVTLSQDEYDALTDVDENTLYLITPL
jgi:hypothetical protein